MTKQCTKALIGTLTAILIPACSSNYEFSSNLDAKAINDYFKAGDVVLFEENQSPKGRYKVLGLIEGEACQTTPNDVPVTLADARTDARRKAADKGATGLIIKSCTQIEESGSGCHSRALCIGQAVELANDND